MITNLKELEVKIMGLEALETEKPLMAEIIRETVKLLKGIRADLEIGGESILELDKQRVDAIKERDKFLSIFPKKRK
jgi:hypothetical protein